MPRKITQRTLLVSAVAAAGLLPGCGAPPSRVSIDLHGLAEQAAVTIDRLDQLRLTVSPGTVAAPDERQKELEIDLSGEALSFEVELAAGNWLFEMVGEETEGLETPNATFFGDLQIELAPHADVDLVIPLFPAGTIAVPVWIAPETGITGAVLSFVPRQPREDQSERHRSLLLPVAQDDAAPEGIDVYQVERALPAGDYDAYVAATVDGTVYSVVEGEPVPIVGQATGELGIEQGVVNRWERGIDIY